MIPEHNTYQHILRTLKEKISQARLKAAMNVNSELLGVYWEIGSSILQQQEAEGWGTKVIDRLATDLKMAFPDFKGFSVRNLKYMRAFAEAYRDYQIVQPVIAQIPWTHHTLILDKTDSRDERLFYIAKTVENSWSKSILTLQIQNNLFQRQGKAITNFATTLPALQSDLARETFKNPYIFDFLNLNEEIQERELENALIQHLKKFMLELGRGFAYIGNQKNLNVEGDDFFLDLLFYNYHLHCFVIFELKVGEFKPKFAGKLNFYVNVVNEQLKGTEDKPTIGILLCKTPNEIVIKHSLTGIATPIGVADYELAQGIPKLLKAEMPTIEELEAEIVKEYEELKSPAEKRLETLKQKLGAIKGEEIQVEATYPILCDLLDKSLQPLYYRIIQKLEDFRDMFVSGEYFWGGKGKITDINEVIGKWKDEEFLNRLPTLPFSYSFHGFRKAGIHSFDVAIVLTFEMDKHWYGFRINNYNNQTPFLKKLYHEQLNSDDIHLIVDTMYNVIIDSIEQQMKSI